ncbi:MAG TPA: 16S rRNA (guanine(527)-N(7))-methyltransferase RsmG [Nitrospira sp.]|nr:16S rRNA (guanine(527)-N(7))-methyltransferase RsmG [Nitrospira sp.]
MEHEQDLRRSLVQFCREIGLSLTDHMVAQFMRYLSLLTHWNKKINLTSITEPEEILIKHFVDSLLSLVVIEFQQHAKILDIGSGPGFPGMPLKIVRSDLHLSIVEPGQKKCSFLTTLTGELRLTHIDLFNGTLKQYGRSFSASRFDIVTLRALRFDAVREDILPLLQPDGIVILYRTAKIKQDQVNEDWTVLSEGVYKLPLHAGTRVISVLKKVAA